MVTAVKSKRKNFFLSYGYFHCWLLKNDLYVVDLLNFLKFNKNSSNCLKTENGVIVGANCQRNFTRSRSVFNAKETQYFKKNENRVRQVIILNIFAYIST